MGYWFFKHFTSNTKFAMPGLGQGLGERLKLSPRNARKNTGFATSSPSTMFQIYGDV